ncbi:MAG: hypothetical protein IKO58_03135 [Prevotella sp.]|nr:hypothetical protein [Prevotella sp.]
MLLQACKSEPYDTGDGSLSYMKAEMCDIYASNSYVTKILTDEDVELNFAQGLRLNVICASDTVIRCMLYYSERPSEPISIQSSIEVKVIDAADTLKFNRTYILSRWESRNKKYINFRIEEKQGVDSLYSEKKYYSVLKTLNL